MLVGFARLDLGSNSLRLSGALKLATQFQRHHLPCLIESDIILTVFSTKTFILIKQDRSALTSKVALFDKELCFVRKGGSSVYGAGTLVF